MLTFHLIGNAHLDPVWLWDWQEGLNEGLITCRTILDLMDEDKELTFSRGESVVYQHIEQTDPATFARIKRMVAEGRWEVVGGTVVQSDTNLPATETFVRQYMRGQQYFQRTFGQMPRTAWAADSFGHAAGLPDIMAGAGITSFAFTRPQPGTLPLAKPVFWWEGDGGAKILSYRPPLGWYGTERDEVNRRMDGLLAEAQQCDVANVGVCYGLGNHGGGPTRRQLADIRAWAKAHPEVRVIHSGFHRFFDALFAEVKRNGEDFLPVYHGELNFCLRGCYASVAKFKFAYRKTEAMALRAEKTDAIIKAAMRHKADDTGDIWDSILFNTFHDILPGSSIERAYDQQIAWLGGAQHRCEKIELAALNELAAQVDTRVRKPEGDHPSCVAALVWNPHPWTFDGPLELEASLEYRPIHQYENENVDKLPMEVVGPDGKVCRFQSIATEHSASINVSWRKRVVTPVKLPPFGWSLIEFGWVEGARPVPPTPKAATAPKAGVIDNGFYRVAAQLGKSGINIRHNGKALFGAQGLGVAVYGDHGGSWGGGDDEPGALKRAKPIETWTVDRVETIEKGPERTALWVRFSGKQSWIELTLSVSAGRDAIDVSARVLWNEQWARLKLVMPGADEAEFDVPGTSITRKPCGEVPGGRWVRVKGPGGIFGFASDSLYGFDCTNGKFRATVARASRYANSQKSAAFEQRWRPFVDCGELKFRFLISPGDARLPQLAAELEQPPAILLVPPHRGKLPRSGTFASLTPDNLELLALKAAEDGDGFVLRVRETVGRSTKPVFNWMGQKLALGTVKANSISTWRLQRSGSQWKAVPTSLLED